MYFFGETNNRGTYFFYSQLHNGWIVANLDNRKCELYSRLVILEVTKEAEDYPCLGFEEDKIILDYDDLVPILREYPEDVKVVAILEEDGSQKTNDQDAEILAEFAREVNSKINKDGIRLHQEEENEEMS